MLQFELLVGRITAVGYMRSSNQVGPTQTVLVCFYSRGVLQQLGVSSFLAFVVTPKNI
jgi:hypothetical protein